MCYHDSQRSAFHGAGRGPAVPRRRKHVLNGAVFLLSALLCCSSAGCSRENEARGADAAGPETDREEAVLTENGTDGEDPDAVSPFDDFHAVVRFAVASDLQYGEDTAKSGVTDADLRQRLKDFIDFSAKEYVLDEDYGKCDLIALVGDLTANGTVGQMEDCRAVTDAALPEGTELLAVMGNHEFYSGYSSEVCVKIFNRFFGDGNKVLSIGGYTFIGVSCMQNEFTDETLTWLDARISEVEAADPSGVRPIFVFNHQNPEDTVLGSQSDRWGWAAPMIGEVLKKHPRVVDFTGHSHFAAEDPASFWQGEYAVVNTGTLAHLCKFNTDSEQITVTDCDKQFNLDGKFDYACGWLAEADAAGNLALRSFDVLSGQFTGELYRIAAGKKEYLSSERFRDARIFFGSDAKIEITDTSIRSVGFTFDVCSPEGFPANNYLFEVSDAEGNPVLTEYMSYEYFERNPNKTVSAKIRGLSPGTAYVLRVYGINPLYCSTVTDEGRLISEPLAAEFVTKEE